MAAKPTKLGEALSQDFDTNQELMISSWFWKLLQQGFYFGLLACLSALALWWFLGRPDVDAVPALIFLTAMIVFWWFVHRQFRGKKQHFLLANDRQGFMRDLQLDEKTAVFDGSNIYHLGRAHKLDAQPLGEIVYLLRLQGYRIVCFFDANIFHTLGEHGAFPTGKRHSLALLERIFGLQKDEIYIVPGGVQADKYILECLKFMPISFAVSNDKYRDYASQYPTVMKDKLWRKGVAISGDEIKLLQHNF